jgi:hypothetical protein
MCLIRVLDLWVAVRKVRLVLDQSLVKRVRDIQVVLEVRMEGVVCRGILVTGSDVSEAR